MSTFHARSATEALFPWSLIWISEDTAANSLKIVRLNALHSFPNCELDAKEDLKSLRTGRTVHHLLQMTHRECVWKTKEDLKSLKTGRTVHHQLRMTHRECVWKLKLDRLKSLEVQIEIKL